MTDNIRKNRHTSISVEHYTPSYVVEAAREALGGEIDLDPASCPKAQETVKAHQFWSLANNDEFPTLARPWHGKVFLNPPGGREVRNQSSQKVWWFKLAKEFLYSRVTEAVFIGFSIEILQTTQVNPPDVLLPIDGTLCFPSRRMRHTNADGQIGKSPPHAGVIVYLGPNHERFKSAFAKIGRCK